MSGGAAATPSRARAVWSLLVALAVIGAAIFFSRPSAADVSFNVEAASFDIPTQLALSLYQGGQFEIKTIQAFGFSGRLEFQAATNFRASENRQLPPGKNRLDLALGDALPFLQLSREGGVENLSLTVDQPATIEATTLDRKPALRVTSRRDRDVQMTIDSASIQIEKSSYYVVSQISPKPLAEFSGRFTGNRTAHLVLESHQSGQTSAELSFLNQGGEMQLAKYIKLPDRDNTLFFHDATYADISINKETAGDPTLARPTPIRMEIERGNIESIELLPASGDAHAKLRIKGNVDARSVRESEKELRPTALADLMRDPWAGRNLKLMAWGLLVAGALKVVSYVIDVFLKNLIGA